MVKTNRKNYIQVSSAEIECFSDRTYFLAKHNSSFGRDLPAPRDITLPTEREHTGCSENAQKKSIEVQHDRYALSEPTKLVLGMSHNNKTIFQKFSSVRLFLGPINSLAWKFDVQIGENLLISVVKLKIPCFLFIKEILVL